MKFNAKKLLSSVLALAMTVSMLPGLNAFATENTTTATAETETTTVKIGAEVLLESAEWKEYLKGKNVALFTNQVCVDADMNHLADKLYADPDINLVCMFGGEHGLRGSYQAGASVPHCIDATTGLINWSLYNGGTIDTEALGIAPIETIEGVTDELNPKSPSRPTRVMLSGNNGKWYEPIDVILFDLQEIGSKTWTYITNLADMMGACVEAETYYNQSVELIVLDRPSPISSDVVEGTVADFNNSTGYGRIYLPSRYGMTMGELALMINGEDTLYYWATTYPGGPADLYGSATKASSANSLGYWPFQTGLEEGDTEAIITAKNWVKENYKDKLSLGSCKVSVIPCEGYTRDMYWDETGLQFILPSPNMPTAEACLLYAGTVWAENLPVNEGRGSTLPFSIISAPYIDDYDTLAERLNGIGLEGVIFRPTTTVTMVGNSNKYASANYADQLSYGVQIHITDKRAFSPIKTGFALLLTLQAMYGVDIDDPNRNTLGADGQHFYARTWGLDYTMGKDWGTSEIAGFPVGSTEEQVIAKVEELYARTEEELEPFLEIREQYLMDEYNVPEDKELVNTLEPQVTLGYETFLENAAYTKDLKIGLVTNQSGVTTDLQHLADVFANDSNVNLTTLFSTGYGLRGEFQTAEDGEYTDKKTGLTVYRLNENAPTAEQLKNVDMLVFDIQDTGSRSSSVAELMAACIKACAESNKTFAVLDRPNPVGGEAVEGPVDSTGIPSRYGMTAGELALYFANEQGVSNVKVYEMKGYDRDMFYDETGLQFIQTDLKIGNTESQNGYTALSWLEGTSLSYGWGTTKSYLFFGAPYVKEQMVEFANALNELNLPGVRFRLAAMAPWNNTTEEADIIYGGLYEEDGTTVIPCYGAQLHIMDEHEFNAIETVVNILVTAQKFFGDELTFNEKFTEIVGNEDIATAIKAGKSADEILATFESDLTAFNAKRESALIYGTEKTVSAKDYTDVAADATYFKAVDYMVSNGYMNGTSSTTFAPDSELTRAQVVTILYRIAGEPSVKGLEVNFSDVEDSWYTDAVKWAVSEGIVTGHEDGTFRPNDAMTRDQMIAVLYRYAKKPTADSAALNGITDTATIPPYATSAMAWAVANGIIAADNNALNAIGTASRAQTAVSFFSYLSK